jgi:hypothetical protein
MGSKPEENTGFLRQMCSLQSVATFRRRSAPVHRPFMSPRERRAQHPPPKGLPVKKRILQGSALVMVVAAASLGGASIGGASIPSGPSLTNVATANSRSDGYAPAPKLSTELTQAAVAQGATLAENPTPVSSTYGYDNDVLNSAGQPQMVPTPTQNTEAHKTEPDKNVYLTFRQGLKGADPAYDYGAHFLFQGHEGGAGGIGYITRINLDADAAHRLTILATTDTAGKPISTIDGTTWDPWAKRLLFTTENSTAPTYSATPDFPSTVEDISGALGRGGYEGIQNDSAGNLWIAEDIGGSAKKDSSGNPTTAKRPNSFLYRYVPDHPGDLHNGKLQVLQATSAAGQPLTFESMAALNNADQVALHTFGNSFTTTWVTIHDTAVDGNASFTANDLAKAKFGTPFKRPENGVFRPGSRFREFFFDETGDTNATSPENPTAGGWGSILRLTQDKPGADTGHLTLFYNGDQAHSGLDNVTFLSEDKVTFVEDAGATLHQQRNALDSGYVFDVNVDYSKAANQPVRWLAQGRDPSATIDAANGGFAKNDDDNEITGVHVSDGDPGIDGILGAKKPRLFDDHSKWRWFYTQQHGDNPTYEVLSDSVRKDDRDS